MLHLTWVWIDLQTINHRATEVQEVNPKQWGNTKLVWELGENPVQLYQSTDWQNGGR